MFGKQRQERRGLREVGLSFRYRADSDRPKVDRISQMELVEEALALVKHNVGTGTVNGPALTRAIPTPMMPADVRACHIGGKSSFR